MTPIDPIYCPVCRKEIAKDAAVCPACGAKTSALERKQEAFEQEAERVQRLASERAAEKALREEQKRIKEGEKLQLAEAQREALFNKATGHGICPHCKSPNVKPYTFTEGGSGAGQSMACCLGCAFNPLAWLLIPFMQGKKKRGYECQYCSNKWRL